MRIVNKTAVLGENLAVSYLTKKGYKIIERNFRKKYEEIDVIAVHNSTLVFIEVKTRKSDSFGTASESVTPWKIHHLVQLAQFYKQLHPHLPDHMRIDLVAVTLDSKNILVEVEQIENISDL